MYLPRLEKSLKYMILKMLENIVFQSKMIAV